MLLLAFLLSSVFSQPFRAGKSSRNEAGPGFSTRTKHSLIFFSVLGVFSVFTVGFFLCIKNKNQVQGKDGSEDSAEEEDTVDREVQHGTLYQKQKEEERQKELYKGLTSTQIPQYREEPPDPLHCSVPAMKKIGTLGED